MPEMDPDDGGRVERLNDVVSIVDEVYVVHMHGRYVTARSHEERVAVTVQMTAAQVEDLSRGLKAVLF